MSIECCICKEPLLQSGSRLSSTPCGHVYHRQCLLTWIENNQNKGNCPVCRADFDPFNIIPLLTLDEYEGTTSSGDNNQKLLDLENKHKEMQSLLETVMDSLSEANEALKAKDLIIEKLNSQKSQSVSQNPAISTNSVSFGSYDDSELSELMNSLGDDELELNFRIS